MWFDVNLDNPFYSVSEVVQHLKTVVVGPTETGAVENDVVVQPRLEELLGHHLGDAGHRNVSFEMAKTNKKLDGYLSTA